MEKFDDAKKTRKVAKNFADISTHTSVESISNFESGKIMTARRLIDIFLSRFISIRFHFISVERYETHLRARWVVICSGFDY
jgi:hypothetical protein